VITPRQAAFAVAGWGAFTGYGFFGWMGAFFMSAAVYALVRMMLRDVDF
jgi:hypothetical protein